MINQNPDQFFQLFNEGLEGGDDALDASDGAQYISITPEEEAAINRVSLFFLSSYSWLLWDLTSNWL